MALSGIKCDPSVVDEYKKMSSGTNKPYRYIIFKIETKGEGKSLEYTKVIVDKTGDRGKTFEDLKDELEENSSRFAVFDLSYHTAREGQLREKIIFLKFVPENANRKEKMVYSSTEKELTQKLGTASIAMSKHFDCKGEINENEYVEELAKKS